MTRILLIPVAGTLAALAMIVYARQPRGDPDCRLGAKTSHNQVRADGTTTSRTTWVWGYGSGVAAVARTGHPRSFGTFPRVIRRHVRERQLLRLEEAVRKMTGAAAERIALIDRANEVRPRSLL